MYNAHRRQDTRHHSFLPALFLLTRIYELQGDVVDETFNTDICTYTFCSVRPLCFVRLRDAFDELTSGPSSTTVLPFLGEVLRKMAGRSSTSAAPRRRPKRHTWQWNGSLRTKASTVSSLYVVHAHTQCAYNNICTLSFVSNTQHPTPKKRKGEKQGKTCADTPFYQPCARARAIKTGGFAHAPRLRAHRIDARRVRFLRRVVARGDMGRFAFSRAQSSSSSSFDASHDHRRPGRRGRTRL